MTQIAKTRKGLSRNFTGLVGNDTKNTELVIRELQDKIKELQLAVNELQTFQVSSRVVESDGTPLHLSKCELLDGQWLRLAQMSAAPMIVKVEHGLRRKPQGIIWTLTGQLNNQALIAGDLPNGIDPADSVSLSIRLNGSVGDIHTGILF